MSLRAIGAVVLPPHRGPGAFDHASVYGGADRLYVAHTANDGVDVIDLGRRQHEMTLDGFPGVAGVAVCQERGLLVATCRSEGTTALVTLDDPARIQRISVGPRPNGLALASRCALVASIGTDSTGPSFAILDLDSGAVLSYSPLPGRPRWTVHDEGARAFYVNIAAPPQILVVSDAPPPTPPRSLPKPDKGVEYPPGVG